MARVISLIEDNTHIFTIDSGSTRENLLVYLESTTNKKVALANANSMSTSVVIGVIMTDNGTTVTTELLETAAEITCVPQTGITLASGDNVFLSDVEAGTITNVPPSVQSRVVFRIGVVDVINVSTAIIATSIGQPIEL